MSTVTITLNLDPACAAGLKRFADKVAHSDAMAVLYPHVALDVRNEQAYQIVQGFEVLCRALCDARVSDWPWIESGQPTLTPQPARPKEGNPTCFTTSTAT